MYTVLCDSTIIEQLDDLEEAKSVAKAVWEKYAKDFFDAGKNVDREVYVFVMDENGIEVWDDDKDYTEEDGKTHYYAPKPSYFDWYDRYKKDSESSSSESTGTTRTSRQLSLFDGDDISDDDYDPFDMSLLDSDNDLNEYENPPYKVRIYKTDNAYTSFSKEFDEEDDAMEYGRKLAKQTARALHLDSVYIEVFDARGVVVDYADVDNDGRFV